MLYVIFKNPYLRAFLNEEHSLAFLVAQIYWLSFIKRVCISFLFLQSILLTDYFSSIKMNEILSFATA
jgi:hypothetical protein